MDLSEITCDVCSLPVDPDDDYHTGHESGCPRKDNPDSSEPCRCDLVYHAECCPDCRETIPALTLWQPWAWLVAEEIKEFETRSWATKYRGPLAIHAALRKVQPSDVNSTIASALAAKHRGVNQLARGGIVCIVDLVDCIPAHKIMGDLSDRERSLGYYTYGRFAWKLTNVRKFPAIPAKGKQGLWRWTFPDSVRGLL